MKREHREKKMRAGWVFRVEIVTDKPSLLTIQMIAAIRKGLLVVPNVTEVGIRELFEDIEFFDKKERSKTA